MTKDEIVAWALGSGWQVSAGHPSLMKPSNRKEAIVRMLMKATVVTLEVKKPSGKWEKIASQSYPKVTPHPDGGLPQGMGFEQVPGLSMLMQDNKDSQAFAGWG